MKQQKTSNQTNQTTIVNTKSQKNNSYKKKAFILFGIVIAYLMIASIMSYSVSTGHLQKSSPVIVEVEKIDTDEQVAQDSTTHRLRTAQIFFEENFVKANGHIDLYIVPNGSLALKDNNTNSEAISYYMLWTAKEQDKKNFDKSLRYLILEMSHPRYQYMMWRLDDEANAVGDGSNIATDADLRAIRALLIAEKQWGDEKYTKAINQLATGLERVGITEDGYLAPYAGVSGGNSIWTAKEVWLSYSDFTVFQELANRRGKMWPSVNEKMKQAILDAQIANGLYNSMLTEKRQFGNGIDGSGYSINSIWIMIRNAESGDKELMQSANKSLAFYKMKFEVDGELYALYGSNGDALSSASTPWVYALVGSAAVALNDKEFSSAMMKKLLEYQHMNNQSTLYGSFPEGNDDQIRVGQFTMQESIIALQAYNAMD